MFCLFLLLARLPNIRKSADGQTFWTAGGQYIYSMNHLLSLTRASKNFWESTFRAQRIYVTQWELVKKPTGGLYCEFLLVVLSLRSDSYVLLPISQDPECTKIGSTWVAEQWVFISCDHALFWTCLFQRNALWGIGILFNPKAAYLIIQRRCEALSSPMEPNPDGFGPFWPTLQRNPLISSPGYNSQ